MTAMADGRVAPYLGRVLTSDGGPAGTCFQVSPGVVVTAWHVLDDLGAADEGSLVMVDPLGGGPAGPAKVVRLDPLHDLAVLSAGEVLSGCVAGLTATDEMAIPAPVVITGVPDLYDPDHEYRHWDAAGTWAGGTTRDNEVPLGRVEASAVLKGMSGAPVIVQDADPGQRYVAGVVSARYNSPDGWARDSVLVARTEDLMPLLAGLGEVTMVRPAWSDAIELVLSVTDTQVRLTGHGTEVSAGHQGVTAELADAIHGLRTGRARLTGVRSQDLADAPPSRLHATPAAVGELMAQAFLPVPVAAALAEAIAGAQSRWTPVRLGIEAEGPLRELPWEALCVPGSRTPLVLHPLVVAYRRHGSGSPAPALSGPLRIVVAVSAPLSGGGQVLDYERELRNVLAAVRGARQGQAQVRIVHFATTAEIRAALTAAPAHILHLSGHGLPGRIELEDDEGNARILDAATFAAEAIPPGRMPPLVALAACHTDAAASADAQSFAAALLDQGALAVIGTETAVTDVYATRVFARVYGELAAAGSPEVIEAVSQARRVVQQQLSASQDRRDQHLAVLGEWAVLTVLAASGTVSLLDPSAAPDSGPSGPEPGRAVPSGLLARDTGEFVGRRRAQRRWPAELLAPGGTGLVLHGIGGVGKTTLAAELIRRITEREPARLPVIASSGLSRGQVTVDQILTAIARALRLRSAGTRPDLDQAARVAEQPDLDWQLRLQVLQDQAGDLPVLIVLDNFEDNLIEDDAPARPGSRTITDQDLASLLAKLVVRPGRWRLLVTSRYPFTLPGNTEQALSFHPVGPLTIAETMKLAWALPALDKLTASELDRVWRLVGGHPRCLEYLDALLSGGRGAYPDVTARLAARLDDQPGLPAQGDWFTTPGSLEPAIAQTLTLAADDILLDQLLASLRSYPGAESLLLGLSVYRTPVDEAGLLFQAGIPDPDAESIPDRRKAREEITAILAAAKIELEQPTDLSALPAGIQAKLRPHLAELGRLPTPPRRAPESLRRTVYACAGSSLLTLLPDQNRLEFFVHRWTASELHTRWIRSGHSDEITLAHQNAAGYWIWRVRVWPQDQDADLADRTEARHHLFAAGQPKDANRITEHICSVLHDQGAWDREDALIRDTLHQLPLEPALRYRWAGQLADIARGRGRTREATELYGQYLALAEELARLDPGNAGYRRDVSVSHVRLGDLARDAGDAAEAARRYQQALAVREELARLDPGNAGYRRDVSVSHNKLGDLARDAGDAAEAARRYQQSLAVAEELARLDPGNAGYRRDVSVSHNKLGDLARDAGDAAEAARRYQQALAVAEELARLDPGNAGYRRDVSVSHERLGDLARDAGDAAEAARRYQQSLAVAEELARLDPGNAGYRRDVSVSHERLGDLARDAGDAAEAARRYQQSLAVAEELARLDPGNAGYRRDVSVSHERLGDLARDAGDAAEAARRYQQSLAVAEELARLDPGNAGYRRDVSVSHNKLGDLARDAGDAAEAARRYQQSLAVAEELARLDPGNAGYRRDVSVSHERLGDLARDAGDAAEAARRYQQALAVREELARLDPGNAGYRRDVSVSHNKLGDLARDAGDAAEAARRYQQALAVREELARLDPGNAGYRRDVSVSHVRLGDLARDAGDAAEAARRYQQALAVREELARLDPGNAGYRRDVSVSHNKLGDLARDAGDAAEAARRYQQSLAVAEELARLDPGNAGYRRDVSVSHNKLGDLARDAGDAAEAARRYQQALAVAEELARLDPGNAGYRRDVSVSHERLGDLARDAGDAAEAARRYQQALAVREELARLDPGNAGYRRDVSVSHNKLGDLARDAGDAAEAARRYQQSLAVAEELARLDPGNAGYRRDVSVSHNKLGDLARDAGDAAEAARRYQQALAVAEELARLDPGNAGYRRDVSVSHERLGDLARDAGDAAEAARRYQQALAVAEELARLDPGNAGYRRDVSVSHNKLGDLARDAGDAAEAARRYQQALAVAEELARLDPGNAGYRRDVSVSHDRLGDLARDAGDAAEAARRYQQALAVAEELARLDPGNAGYRRDVSVSHERLGDLARDAGDAAEAARRYQQSLTIREELARLDPGNVGYQRDLGISYGRLADLSSGQREAVTSGQIYERAVDFCGQVYGPDHPLTLAVKTQLQAPAQPSADREPDKR